MDVSRGDRHVPKWAGCHHEDEERHGLTMVPPFTFFSSSHDQRGPAPATVHPRPAFSGHRGLTGRSSGLAPLAAERRIVRLASLSTRASNTM